MEGKVRWKIAAKRSVKPRIGAIVPIYLRQWKALLTIITIATITKSIPQQNSLLTYRTTALRQREKEIFISENDRGQRRPFCEIIEPEVSSCRRCHVLPQHTHTQKPPPLLL